MIMLILIMLFSSCDILRSSPFEVSCWSPGGGYHADPGAISVSVSFSHDPDRTSAEKYFSLTVDGEKVRGFFQWQGKKMIFFPFNSLEKNRDYSVRISPNACDTAGLSMDREFEGFFSTRDNYERPRIVNYFPGTDGTMENKRGTCTVEFSTPFSLNSLRSNASFSPTVQGAWHLEKNGTLAVFTPTEPWTQGSRFNLRISASLAGENGMGIGKEFNNFFTIGAFRELPSLICAMRVNSDGGQTEIFSESSGLVAENAGWEKNDSLLLVFSAKVDLLSVGAAVSAEGSSPPVLKMHYGSEEQCFSEEAVLNFEKPPPFNSRFSIRLKQNIRDIHGNESNTEHIFKIYANGEKSKPPSLAGIRIPMAPSGSAGDETDFQMIAFGPDQLFADLPIESENYPYTVKTSSWIECYFDCAPGASVDVFSLMESFRIETSNNVLSFNPLVIRNDNFTVSDPHTPWEHCRRMEIAGTIVNTVNSGVVHFIVNQGLRDSFGNTSEKQFRFSLNK